MKLIEKYLERKGEPEKVKVERFLIEVKEETEAQIGNLKKANQKLKNDFKESKEKTNAEIDVLTEQIDDYLIDYDLDKIKDKNLRKEYKKDFICGYIDKILEIEVKNKNLDRIEKVFEEKVNDNKDSILKLQSFLNELV